jgi:NADH-ubiquinone oxidoreductase chain 5
LLFLGAGSVIHSLFDEQDMRRMGGLVNYLPLSFIGFFIGSLAIVGFPFLSGFYSKDLILELTFCSFIVDGYFLYFIALSSAFFTSLYSIRLFFFVFCGKSNLFFSFMHLSDGSIFIVFPLFFLSICSIFAGFIFCDVFVGWGSFFFNTSIFMVPFHFSLIDSEFIYFFVKLLPILFSLFGILVGFLFCYFVLSYFKLIFLVFNRISIFFFLLLFLIVCIMIFFYIFIIFLIVYLISYLINLYWSFLVQLVFLGFFLFFLFSWKEFLCLFLVIFFFFFFF